LIDPEFGWRHVRVQTWAPYSQQYWRHRHVFCMQDTDTSGEPIFINPLMALIFT